jgi:hypothetical protein
MSPKRMTFSEVKAYVANCRRAGLTDSEMRCSLSVALALSNVRLRRSEANGQRKYCAARWEMPCGLRWPG